MRRNYCLQATYYEKWNWKSKKRENPPPREIPKDIYTVRDKIKHIRETVLKKDATAFEELFDETSSTVEIVTTFQALLELLKHQFIVVEQEEMFSSITIKKNPNRREDEDIGEIDEYNWGNFICVGRGSAYWFIAWKAWSY